MKQSSKKGKRASMSPTAASRAMMERALSGVASKAEGKIRKSQELAYDAMEAPSLEEHVDLLDAALELDPHNVDALLMLLDCSSIEGAERIEILRHIVAVGEKRLGKKAFREMVPHFWGILETRPYMRALAELAEELRESGQVDEAIKEYTAMVNLNHNDNQGVRYHLLPCLLAQGKLEEAQALMKLYENDSSVVFMWGAVLERYLAGDEAGAQVQLKQARESNPHVEIYLKGHRRIPRNLPEYYSMGTKEEAVSYAEPLLMAWSRYPEAQNWLIGQAGKSGKPER
ncbi:MAG: tetratricopeptide repeat protein [Oceanipulchritudo sp.]